MRSVGHAGANVQGTAPQDGPRGQIVRVDGVAAATGTNRRPPAQIPSPLPRTGTVDFLVWPALVGFGLILAGLVTWRGFGRRS